MWRHSVLSRLGLLASVVVFAYLLASTLWSTAVLYRNASDQLEAEISRESDDLAVILGPLIWNLDEQSVKAVLLAKARNAALVEIRVSEQAGSYWQVTRTENGLVDFQNRRNDQAPELPADTRRQRDIGYSNTTFGQVAVSMRLGPRLAEVNATLRSQFVSQFLLYLAVLAALYFSWRGVGKRLAAMVDVLKAFSGEQAEVRMPIARDDELGYLARGFNSMADRVFASSRAKEQEIKDRSDRLVEAEQLALLGSLVAGVAHEINTPVGNCVTAASWLASRVATIQEQSRDGCLPPEDLVLFLNDSTETLRIIESSLARTASLIQAFKKIGADQVADQRIAINLALFFNDVVLSLSPTYKRHAQVMVVDCPLDIELTTTPGALYQVVSNLVINAFTHAYPDDRPGTITIRGSCGASNVLIQVVDDGIGMDSPLRDKAFLPFFTTRRHQGGTGLGLSIAKNLVKGLGGTLDLKTAPGQGCCFTIELPCAGCIDA